MIDIWARLETFSPEVIQNIRNKHFKSTTPPGSPPKASCLVKPDATEGTKESSSILLALASWQKPVGQIMKHHLAPNPLQPTTTTTTTTTATATKVDPMPLIFCLSCLLLVVIVVILVVLLHNHQVNNNTLLTLKVVGKQVMMIFLICYNKCKVVVHLQELHSATSCWF